MIKVFEVSTGNHAGRIGIDCRSTLWNRVKLIPGARFSKADGVWTVPKAWPAVLSIGAFAREVKQLVHPTSDLQSWVSGKRLAWAAIDKLSDTLLEGEKAEGLSLYPHQVAGASWLTYGKGVEPVAGRLLLDETGCGKTGTVIEALNRLNVYPALITCPKSVIRTGWVDSFQLWAPDVRVAVASGSAAQRRKAITTVKNGEADVLVIGHESFLTHTSSRAFPGHTLRRCPECGGPQVGEADEITAAKCQKHAKELQEVSWRVIVVDEIHKAMTPTSLLAQALWGAAAEAPDALRWALTGTLISKKTEQAWSSLRFVDPEGWPVKASWIDYYLEKGYNNDGFLEVKGVRKERDIEFRQTFSAISRRVLKEQVLDLPPILRGGSLVRELDMGAEQRKAYVEMREQMVTLVKEGKITAQNALVQAGRLTLLASATGYPIESDSGKKAMGLRLPSNKLAAFLTDLKEDFYEEAQVMVLFESRKLLRLCEKTMLDAGYQEGDLAIIAGDVTDQHRAYAIQDFQTGKKRFVLLTMAAGGTGITLNKASMVAMIQRSWSPILNKQSLDRAHRIGSEIHKAITVVDYMTAGSIEIHQMARLAKDGETYEDLVQDQQKLLDFFSAK